MIVKFHQMQRSQGISKDRALQKIRHYCSYQERCHSEVRAKLYSLGLWRKDVEEIISELIEKDYLNEERFAMQFAGGKFRIKQWGRVKIKLELKQKQVSEYCIKKALEQIDEEIYLNTLKKIAMKKWESLYGEKNIFIKKRKLQIYLLQKGFEAALVNDRISSAGNGL